MTDEQRRDPFNIEKPDCVSQSANISDLAKALSEAQGEITGAKKDSSNPFFKSSYADLASCWDACRGPLSDHGLSVIQTTKDAGVIDIKYTQKDQDTREVSVVEGKADRVTIVTTLAHESGQWIRGEITMTPEKPGPQAMGSCLTYARRYALAAIVGLAQIDDDANAASGKSEGKAPPVQHDNPQKVMPMGKHKGVAYEELPQDYLEWAVQKLAEGTPKERCKQELERRNKEAA